MSLRMTFANSITFTVINEYGKGAAVDTESVFWPIYHVACRGVFLNIYLTTSLELRNLGNT